MTRAKPNRAKASNKQNSNPSSISKSRTEAVKKT
jgi:hypothetical protein